jgi:hypothetical protein
MDARGDDTGGMTGHPRLMYWLSVLSLCGALGIGSLVTYLLMRRRLRALEREAALIVDSVIELMSSPRKEPRPRGRRLDQPLEGAVDTGIEVVDTDGRVVGTAVMQAPALN